MLIRPRKSRIYYLRRFFDYPISLNVQTLRNLQNTDLGFDPAQRLVAEGWLLADDLPLVVDQAAERFDFFTRPEAAASR